ncbi:hypothetical protein TrispH2_009669 [Trichoplax sp. H2]|uniref:RING-type domain-containing protein n=1 Tax=Trichoplax adhaerens TaxID=10228 RepID=B3S8S7_TRIAD|nr:predicted protein [Trichoplax adhaerens]EDV21005.1 predicted protein [Trichoplax adhaerens]RDD38473.1 hypothetical protein TrispH2_009669 [Trichoplax sp. H2]|eukprot:XP_002116649.1 predicted protein [Trichoplax adhaerens]
MIPMAKSRKSVAVSVYVELCRLLTQPPSETSCSELLESCRRFQQLMICTWCRRLVVFPVKSKLCCHYVCKHCRWTGRNQTALCQSCNNRERFENAVDEECKSLVKCFNCLAKYVSAIVDDLVGNAKTKIQLNQLLIQIQEDYRCEDEIFHSMDAMDEESNRKKRRGDTEFLIDALSPKERINLSTLD